MILGKATVIEDSVLSDFFQKTQPKPPQPPLASYLHETDQECTSEHVLNDAPPTADAFDSD